jgi:hypothetical protein
MWLGKGSFESYGYQHPNSYIKGQYRDLLPNQCYRIKDGNPGNNSDQYWVVPVDEQGNETGQPAFKTAGQVMYSIWEEGKSSPSFFISDSYM